MDVTWGRRASARASVRSIAFGAVLATIGAWVPAAGAPKDYPGCDPLKDSDFRMATLVSRTGHGLDEPLKMAFDLEPGGDAAGRVDIYFVERKGKVRRYRASDKSVATLGSVAANTEFEGGLAGIALDPAFRTNRRLYLFYGHGGHGTGAEFRFRLSRFTLDAQGMLDAGSERVVLAIPAGEAKLHTGGAMLFDGVGNLLVTVGDNDAAEAGPGNTDDLRGKILRIRPRPFPEAGPAPAPGPGSTYDIPAGNLFASGVAKTRPEIYVMGTRNAYSLGLDPVRGLVAWGDVGPDGRGTTEEHNVTKGAANHGYPFFAGDQVRLTGSGTAAAPINNHPGNTGLANLPPAVAATRAYGQAAAITGPIYRYDAKLASTIKFPPHFEGMWFVTDFNQNGMDTVLLDAAGTKMLAAGPVFRNMRLDRPLDFRQGPDGALYAINYSGWFGATATTAIVRIEYHGTCRPGPGTRVAAPAQIPGRVSVRGSHLAVEGLAGEYRLRILDTRGSRVAAFRGRGAGRHALAGILPRGPAVLIAELEADGGRWTLPLAAGIDFGEGNVTGP